jgi:hypothetical protein
MSDTHVVVIYSLPWCAVLLIKLLGAELLPELAKKERQQGIYRDPEVDLFMKVCTRYLLVA